MFKFLLDEKGGLGMARLTRVVLGVLDSLDGLLLKAHNNLTTLLNFSDNPLPEIDHFWLIFFEPLLQLLDTLIDPAIDHVQIHWQSLDIVRGQFLGFS